MAASEDKLTKHTLNLFEGDFAKLGELYPALGAGVVVRQLVRNYLVGVEAKSAAEIKTEVNL